ncbi:MAG: hypothetical protein HYR76_03995 [Ignavibacteria bacterium]|nr:hypothetical protein [Ignavibacteria bacterium]
MDGPVGLFVQAKPQMRIAQQTTTVRIRKLTTLDESSRRQLVEKSNCIVMSVKRF